LIDQLSVLARCEVIFFVVFFMAHLRNETLNKVESAKFRIPDCLRLPKVGQGKLKIVFFVLLFSSFFSAFFFFLFFKHRIYARARVLRVL